MKIQTYFLSLCLLAFSVPLVAQAKSPFPFQGQANPFPGSRLYVPTDGLPHTSLVMLHGSEGGSNFAGDIEATLWAATGYRVLLLCYFDCGRFLTGPRKSLIDVEAHLVLDAVQWMRSQSESNGKVVVYGISRGGELAMIAGSLDTTPQNKPSALIAHSPSDQFNGPYNWDWNEPACWLCSKGFGRCRQLTEYIWNPACGGRDPNTLPFDESAFLVNGRKVASGTSIEVEKFDGPIFISVGEKDEVWPSEQTHRLEARLKTAGRHPEVHYFPNGGHGLRGPDELKRRDLMLDFLQRLP